MAPNGLVWIISSNEPKKSVLGLQSDMRRLTARTADMVNAHLGFEPSARSRSSSTSLKYSRVPWEKYVNLKESIASFQGVLDGKYNDLSEQSFYMVGGIEEVIAKSEKIAKESAT